MTTKTHHLLPSHLTAKTNQYVVMVVDDMAVNRVLLSKVLNSAGYTVVEAESSDSALELIASGSVKPDVLITDVEMPGKDGIELTEEIRQLAGSLGRLPIIVASGSTEAAIEMDAYEAGADLFLNKPFNLRELREEVAHAVRFSKRVRFSGNSRKREANELRTRLA